MESPDYFTGRGWGMLRTDPKHVYDACRGEGRSFVIVRDNVPYVFSVGEQAGDVLEKYFKELIGMLSDSLKLDSGWGAPRVRIPGTNVGILDSQAVLRYFLLVHQHVFLSSQTKGQSGVGMHGGNYSGKAKSSRDYRFTGVIFVELTTHLSHTVEYFLLLFKYLLNQGLAMPQLFVICDYPTEKFNFIETDIFETKVTKWGLSLGEPAEFPVIKDIETTYIDSYQNPQVFIDMFRDTEKTCVIVSQNGFYEKMLKEYMVGGPVMVYEDIESYIKTPPFERDVGVLLLRTMEELLSIMQSPPKIKVRGAAGMMEDPSETGPSQPLITTFSPSVVLFDTRFRVGINMLYAGNVMMPVCPNEDYVKGAVWKLSRYLNMRRSKLFTYDEGRERIIRGIFTRSPIIDYIQFREHGVDMFLLYTNYYKIGAPGNFMSIIRSEAEMLRTLKYEEPEFHSAFSKCVTLNIHPMVISMIENWFRREHNGKKLPRIAILVFAAVMLTHRGNLVEIKEHGTREHENDMSQTSRYGQIFLQYLLLMQRYSSIVMEEGGRTAKLLRRLLVAYKIEEDEMMLFDHNDFALHLAKMILELYPTFVLTQKNYTTYRSTYNTQMNWTVMQTTMLPRELFPFTVSMCTTKRHIQLYIPLDRV